MRIASLAILAILAAGAVAMAAIQTEDVPYAEIKGEHWDLDFQARLPQRIVVADKDGTEKAYWYVLYVVTNKSGEVRDFVPQAVMLTNTGKIARDGLYPAVLAKVKEAYRVPQIKTSVEMMGPLKAGEDEAREGIFIFPEADVKTDSFTIFVTGLSGEFVIREVPAAGGNGATEQQVFRKTMQMEYDFPGDTVNLAEDKVYLVGQNWIWR